MLRIQLAETTDEADFVFVDDGAPPDCRAARQGREDRPPRRRPIWSSALRALRAGGLSHLRALALARAGGGGRAVRRGPHAAATSVAGRGRSN